MAIASIAFVTSCIGLGYLSGLWVRRHKWPGWVSGLMAFAIACLWPAIAVGFVLYTGNRFAAQHPGEVNDAPAMVLMGVIHISPFIFLFSLSFAVIGLYIARRGGSVGVL
jgi:hypothetical protein